MMSEAMTLVLDDMVYAHTLALSDERNEAYLDTRIYPLFKAMTLPKGSVEEKIKALLKANVSYAVLGDDSKLYQLTGKHNKKELKAYKDHFKGFFIGDHKWTYKNYCHMKGLKNNYKNWIELVGEDFFKKSNLNLLSHVTKDLSNKVDLENFEETV